jgi:uncharacterized Rossmann fold enzyme
MQFTTWRPVYEAILADFAYDRGADERARAECATLATPLDLARLAAVAGAPVAVAGAGPSLPSEVERAAAASFVVAASTAADVLADHGVEVDLLVTDLDKNAATARRLTRAGVPVALHAHGDNVALVREHVPEMADEAVLPTTQAAPVGPVRNFGGFTDGDRGAFLADHLGAGRLAFPGWDFDDPSVGPSKARKLRWAERLLYWLERRRDERFDVLDGRRAAIDTSVLPVE